MKIINLKNIYIFSLLVFLSLPLVVNAQCVFNDTNLNPSAKVIYVNEFNGSDDLAKPYQISRIKNPHQPGQVSAYQSLEKALTQQDINNGDIVLLRRGNTWIDNRALDVATSQKNISQFNQQQCNAENLVWLDSQPAQPALQTANVVSPSQNQLTDFSETSDTISYLTNSPNRAQRFGNAQLPNNRPTWAPTSNASRGGSSSGGSSGGGSTADSDASNTLDNQLNDPQPITETQPKQNTDTLSLAEATNTDSFDTQNQTLENNTDVLSPEDNDTFVSEADSSSQNDTTDTQYTENAFGSDTTTQSPDASFDDVNSSEEQSSNSSNTAICKSDVPWDAQIYRYPQDSNGQSILKPNSDSRILYVSSTEGNDETAQIYMSGHNSDVFLPNNIKPFKTIEKAMSVARDGKPDWVLLKRGDNFELKQRIWMLQGSGRGGNFVLASYGKSKKRPVVDTGNLSAIARNGTKGFFTIKGIEFYASAYDPENDNFMGWSNIDSAVSGIRSITGGESALDIFIEDNIFSYYAMNLLFDGPLGHNNLVIRNNIVKNSYSTTMHSSGIFLSGSSMVLLENNIFDHNGWYTQRPLSVKLNTRDFGYATFYNHNMYLSNNTNMVIRNNLLSRSSSIGIKLTSNPKDYNHIISRNILITDNLFIEGEIGISAGGNTNHRDGHRWGEMYISNNTLSNMGRSKPTNRNISWGIDVVDWKVGEVCGNIITDNTREDNTNTFAIKTSGFNSDVSIKHNKTVNIGVSAEMQQGENFVNVKVTDDQYLERLDGVNFLDEKLAQQGHSSYESFINETLNNHKADFTRVLDIDNIKNNIDKRAIDALK